MSRRNQMIVLGVLFVVLLVSAFYFYRSFAVAGRSSNGYCGLG